MAYPYNIAVVIPCYRVTDHILGVIGRIGSEVTHIYAVDDACPDGSGDVVEKGVKDARVTVLRHAENRGVGGAMVTGYRKAVEDGAEVVVKIDGDGQMDPELIPRFVAPIANGEADYTKGNRFFHPEDVAQMPLFRLLGNAVLSAVTKFSTGYWDLFDPTNGYTAIHTRVLKELPLDKVSERYFFESDMLFRLNTIRAVVMDVPMEAVYGDEKSNLSVRGVAPEFLFKTLSNCVKRFFYNYVLRDTSLATFEMVFGLLLLLFGIFYGGWEWLESVRSGVPASSGTVMLAGLPTILGFQLLLAFVGYDVQNIPRTPLQKRLRTIRELSPGGKK